jgi:hypothetical protein
MSRKVTFMTLVVALTILAHSASAVEVNDTQTWGETDLSGQTTTIGPNGDLTINGRVNLDNGTIILNGGKLAINGDFHFGDSSNDSNPEQIYLNAGTLTVASTESYRDRGAVVFVGAGEMITGQIGSGQQYDPSNAAYWDIQLLEGYGPVQIDDMGGDQKRIWAQPMNAEVEFESAASGALESTVPAQITVVLNRPEEGETYTVDYAVTGGTAEGAGVDYTLDAGTLTFNPGESTKTITIDIVDDGADESDETIELTLSNPTGLDLVLGDITIHTYTIIDPRPRVGFDSPASSASERVRIIHRPARVPVSLLAAAANPLTVDYAVTGGTADNGVDYTLADGTLTFTPGQTTANISIEIVNDETQEADETIELTLSNPGQGLLLAETAQHTLTIIDGGSEPIDADVNQDGEVNFDDVVLIIDNWLECTLNPPELCWQ